MATISTTYFTNRSRTILGPLTTTFTQPPSCSYAAWYLAPAASPASYYAWQGQYCQGNAHNGLLDNTACWPDTTAGAAFPSSDFNGWGFYSPGLLCPTGYTSACAATASGHADWPIQFSMEAGETAVGCCPTGFTCVNPVVLGQTCHKLYTEGDILTTATCNLNPASLVPGVGAFPLTESTTETAATAASASSTGAVITAWTVQQMVVGAPMIQINWKESDLAQSKPSATTSSTTGSNSTAPAAANNDGSGGVATKVVVGAVVGSVVGVALIALLAFFIWRRKRARASKTPEQWGTPVEEVKLHDMAVPIPGQVQELSSNRGSGNGRQELQSMQREELDAGQRSYELHA